MYQGLTYIESGMELGIHYGLYKVGVIGEDIYQSIKEEHGETFEEGIHSLVNLPSNIVNGIKDNFAQTMNLNNLTNYLTTNNYNEIKEYSKSAIQTGATIYSGYKLSKGMYNKASSIYNNYQTNKIMNQVNITSVNNSKISSIGNQYSLNQVSPYNNQKTFIYSSTQILNEYKWRKIETLYHHYQKHGKDFESLNSKDYANKVQEFYQNRDQYTSFVDNEGVIRIYDYKTNTFG